MQNKGEIAIYEAEDGKTSLQVQLENESVWLSLNQLAELFQRDKSVVSKHIKNVFDENELDKKATVANIATVQLEGDRKVERNIECFNLDVIISVGYRVKSKRGTQFRIWANSVLKNHLVKGYTLKENRLKVQKKQHVQVFYNLKISQKSIINY